MDRSLVRQLAPEEEELERKRGALSYLEGVLLQRELDIATLRGELSLFERDYLRIVGTKYADLDRLEAQIAQELAWLSPHDSLAQEQARQARCQAEESEREARAAADTMGAPASPLEDLKKLYRQLAKLIHPDLTTDAQERARRHDLPPESWSTMIR